MQRLIVILTLIVSLSISSFAKTYQITALTTPTITIGNKQLKMGDRFNDPGNIKWVDDKQSMEVKDLSTGHLYIFSKKVFESNGAVMSIADFFLKTNEGSTRGIKNKPLFTESPVKQNFPEKRIALVIGNSNYRNLSYLKNAQKDASDLAETLKQLGFDVMEIYESDYSGMKTALLNFASKAEKYDVALFYYAGHGIQEKGRNYLVPIERELSLASEVELCLNCDDVMQQMEAAQVPAKLMFIDACRHTIKSWSRSADRGLASMEGPIGSVILFSTKSGEVALDGEGFNSPFAESMIKNISIPGISFNDAIEGVVLDTYKLTNHRQQPLKIGSLLMPFSFNPRTQISTPSVANPTPDDNDLLRKANDYYDKKDYAQALKLYQQLADQGNAEAQNVLGYMYQNGYGVEMNYAEAVKWYKKSAEQGDVFAQCNLGYVFGVGFGVEKNYHESVKWYRKSAEQGNAIAQCVLGSNYKQGLGVKQNYTEAVKWYRKSAEQGNAIAQNFLGVMYEGGLGVGQDYTEAVNWFRKSAEQGDTDGQKNLGTMYANGDGVEQNYTEAVKWYRKSAEHGDAYGQCCLGNMYQYGYGVELNYAEAVNWYRKSAEQGNVYGQNNLGNMYRYGYGVELNYAEAVNWYRKSAEQGNDIAQNNLGDMYQYGCGLEQNDAEAVRWYRKSAEQGNATAQAHLGFMYLFGLGVEKNDTEAMKWYHKSADLGHTEGLFGLGCIYENGFGVKKNIDEAYKWYKKAADNGDEQAKKWIEGHSY